MRFTLKQLKAVESSIGIPCDVVIELHDDITRLSRSIEESVRSTSAYYSPPSDIKIIVKYKLGGRTRTTHVTYLKDAIRDIQFEDIARGVVSSVQRDVTNHYFREAFDGS